MNFLIWLQKVGKQAAYAAVAAAFAYWGAHVPMEYAGLTGLFVVIVKAIENALNNWNV